MKTLIVHTRWDLAHRHEFQGLCKASGATLIASYLSPVRSPNANSYIGVGQLQSIHQIIKQYNIDQVFFDCDLKPTIWRNLQKAWCISVVDRSEVILDLFAQHARTYEGKLQVEWAQLQRLSTRLVRGWTHLERQKGGIGLRGPGEKQLETDRRLIRKRIEQINKKLKKIILSRGQNRQARKKGHMPTVALIGYTNVGKSTLFNQLTKSDVFCADQPFATLDPTVRKIKRHPHPFILMDTVGFVHDLPKELLAGFRATLEEIKYADLLIHVLDATDDLNAEKESIHTINAILGSIDADNIPMMRFYNKSDLLATDLQPAKAPIKISNMLCFWGSAQQNKDVNQLLEVIEKCLQDNPCTGINESPMMDES